MKLLERDNSKDELDAQQTQMIQTLAERVKQMEEAMRKAEAEINEKRLTIKAIEVAQLESASMASK